MVLFRNARVNARGTTSGGAKIGECGLDIEVGKSTLVRVYRWGHLSGLVGWGYLLSKEASRHRGFSVFVIPSCFGVVSLRVS